MPDTAQNNYFSLSDNLYGIIILLDSTMFTYKVEIYDTHCTG